MRFVVFEAKYAKTLNNLPDACNFAIDQINKRSYAEDFQDDYDDILCYGIAFFKKRCLVKIKEHKSKGLELEKILEFLSFFGL